MTVDLRSGQLCEPDPLDYITKTVACEPAAPGTPAPLWTSFLERITAADQELQSYLRRVAGYCLTGFVKEHVLFFLYGTGANGKSVFVNTLVGLWDDYAITVNTDMLMMSNTDRHPTEIARLRGVRLAVGSEIEIGRTWAESKIKSLTGGDRLQGRFMRQDFFEFDPQFKLMIVGNNKPSLRGVDEAIRRRLHLIPFTVTIPVKERDPNLLEKLRPEWPAILRWTIDGCLEWQRQGLNPPQAVCEATNSYLEAEDTFELWRDECTTQDMHAWESSADLWASWKAWAERTGEYVGRQRQFSDKLAEHGFAPERDGTRANRRGYRGARLNRPDYTEEPRYGR
jgi:putative DNA primase/helicase